MRYLRILFVGFLILMADFVLWRRWREEYTDEEIFSFSLVSGAGILIAGTAAAIVQQGRTELGVTAWGMILGLYATVFWWSKRKKWNVWETWDSLTGIVAWVWAMTAWMEGIIPAVLAWFSLLVVAGVKNNYRHWRWYKSGKTGVISLVFLGWFAIGQIAVAFLTPAGIYWGGLEIRQWVSAYLLAFVIVAIYLRSGRKIREDLVWGGFRHNGKK